jgi:phosphohistidine phosphatase
MKLYLMRHGTSPSAHEAGVKTDFDRPLAEKGRDDSRRGAAYFEKNGAKPAMILVSPLVRAQQTAKIIGELLKLEPRTYEPLANQVDGMTLYRKVSEDHPEAGEILLIGHQPQLGETANYLTGQYFDLKPAGQIALDINGGGKAAVLWSANPDEF